MAHGTGRHGRVVESLEGVRHGFACRATRDGSSWIIRIIHEFYVEKTVCSTKVAFVDLAHGERHHRRMRPVNHVTARVAGASPRGADLCPGAHRHVVEPMSVRPELRRSGDKTLGRESAGTCERGDGALSRRWYSQSARRTNLLVDIRAPIGPPAPRHPEGARRALDASVLAASGEWQTRGRYRRRGVDTGMRNRVGPMRAVRARLRPGYRCVSCGGRHGQR